MKKKTRTTAWAISSKNNQIIITTASATIARPWRPCYVGHQYIFIGSVENCSLIIWHEKCLADENPLWWYVMRCGWRSGLVCAWESEMKHGGVWCHVSPYAACPNLTHTMSCWLKRAYSRVKVFECTCLYHIQSRSSAVEEGTLGDGKRYGWGNLGDSHWHTREFLLMQSQCLQRQQLHISPVESRAQGFLWWIH